MSTDLMHLAGEHKEWNESFYFNVYDLESNVCMFMRIGLKPNMDERSAFCFIMMPDGSMVGIKATTALCDGALEVNGLRFTMIDDEMRWRLSFDGTMYTEDHGGPRPVRVHFNLEFEARNEVFDYRECVDGEGERLSQQVASEHLEQFGRMFGSLQVGPDRYAINGLGERDHSWGVRDWNAPKKWVWLTAQFSDRAAFNLTKLYVEGGEVTAGFIHLDGRNIPLVKADIRTVLNPDGGPHSLGLSLLDREGGRHEITAKVLRGVQMPHPSRDGKMLTVMHETLAEYHWNALTGYGIAEYLVRQD
jgi:hypothetical protein